MSLQAWRAERDRDAVRDRLKRLGLHSEQAQREHIKRVLGYCPALLVAGLTAREAKAVLDFKEVGR